MEDGRLLSQPRSEKREGTGLCRASPPSIFDLPSSIFHPRPSIFDRCSYRAGNGTRTRDPNLGKVVLYQLSYSRDTSKIGARRASYKLGAAMSDRTNRNERRTRGDWGKSDELHVRGTPHRPSRIALRQVAAHPSPVAVCHLAHRSSLFAR
jgi:hypothetical protein